MSTDRVDIADLVAPRLSDDELTALLAALDALEKEAWPAPWESPADDPRYADIPDVSREPWDGIHFPDVATRDFIVALRNAYPEVRRLATEVRDLRAVRDAAKPIIAAVFSPDDWVPLPMSERLRDSVARYEEGGRLARPINAEDSDV